MKKSSHHSQLVSPSKKLIKRNKKDSYDTIPQEKHKNGELLVQVFKNDKKQPILTLSFNRLITLLEVKNAIYDYMNNNEFDVSDLVGFEVSPPNYVFDYKFELGSGNLEENLQLICLTRSKEKLLDKYKICCCLAIGGFSKVFLVRSKADGKFFAAKFMDKNKKQLMNTVLLQNQKEISLNLSSPFLVKTHQFIENQQFYIFIMDYCPGGELFYLLKQIKCMSQEEARVCFVQILLGIEYMHNCGFMYRDLKPENILLDAFGYLKIADFGLAKPYANKSYSFCGSIQYMAPEIIRGKGHKNQVDFYCLGALLYEMLIGHPPFYDSNSTQEESKARILYDQIQFPQGLYISDAAKDLIIKLTNKNERERLGCFGGSKQIMTHPWVGKINREKYEKKLYFPPFPVNLNQLNFDPDEIGQSQRQFEERIRQSISIAKPKEWKVQQVKKKSKSHNSLTKNIKFQKDKSKNFVISLHHSKDKISPYVKNLTKNGRNNCSLKVFKTEASLEKKKSSNQQYLQNLRFTQANGLKQKENKLFSEASKLRKKGKYYVCNTTTDNNESVSKLKSSKKPMKYKNLNSLQLKQNF